MFDFLLTFLYHVYLISVVIIIYEIIIRGRERFLSFSSQEKAYFLTTAIIFSPVAVLKRLGKILR